MRGRSPTEELEAYLTSHGYGDHWAIYRERVILPAVHGTEPTPIAELASRLGIEDLDKVSKMTYSVRRRFRSTLARIVTSTLDDPAEVENELAHLRRYLTAT